MGSARGFTRRQLLISGLAARLARAGTKGTTFPPDWRRYPDPTTGLEVFRLTDPAYSCTLPAPYNRAIANNSAWMLYCCDRGGSPQAFFMDLKRGETRQLTDAEDLDGRSLALRPDGRAFCYFAGGSLWLSNLGNLRERTLYRVEEGWEREPGMSLEPDGSHVLFTERGGGTWRLRQAPVGRGGARTIVQAPFAIADAIARPGHGQVLYHQGGEALWLARTDGRQNHVLKTAAGRIGTACWSPGGKTVLYLNFPEDKRQLNAIREYNPETGTDTLVAKTSQFADFTSNRDGSVFVGASRNAASPTVLILLRVTRRELTLCEHKASDPAVVDPFFSPDSQRVYFQSDRHGKPAIYCIHVEKLVEKTDSEN